MYEVEQKFAIQDLSALYEQLDKRKIVLSDPVEQIDCYYQHPSRDFATTGEALRMRREGPQAFLTYKGARLAVSVKTRREIEIPIPSDGTSADNLAQILVALGFQPFATVKKKRRTGRYDAGLGEMVLALDEVEGLGTFLEIEIVAPEDQLTYSAALIIVFSDELKLRAREQRSYLRMLLELQEAG
ncbi:MAG: class IV adenylate cyclase [Planctomycetota bacterium]